MDYNKLNKMNWLKKIEELQLGVPESGSGKNGGILKSDLVDVLEKKVEIDNFSKMSEDMIMKVAYGLSGETLLDYCKISKKFARICSKDYFWRKKYQLDFGEQIKIPKHITLKQRYIFKDNRIPELHELLLKYTDYGDLIFDGQVKRYNKALTEFKINIEDEDLDEDEYEGYSDTIGHKPILIRHIRNLSSIVTAIVFESLKYDIDYLDEEYIFRSDFETEYVQEDKKILKLLISVYNKIHNTNYYYNYD